MSADLNSSSLAHSVPVFSPVYACGLEQQAAQYNGPLIDWEAVNETNLANHKVYNFEVEGTHTYIADGMRVHNTSVLSFPKR